jgi:dTMP kinase
MSRGLLVTFEGPEGGGKSTQLRLLGRRLAAEGYRVTATREPGGTPVGERIREILLDPALAGDALRPEAEAFLFCAARAQIVAEVIRPALAAGHVVLCDRFADATLAYQGFGRGLDLALLRANNALATGGLTPDLTVLLDLPVELGLARRQRTADLNRLDAAGLAFHERVRVGYHALARQDGDRWVQIDAGRAADVIAEEVGRAVRQRLAAVARGGLDSAPALGDN